MITGCFPKILKKSMDQFIHNAKSAGGDMSPAVLAINKSKNCRKNIGEKTQVCGHTCYACDLVKIRKQQLNTEGQAHKKCPVGNRAEVRRRCTFPITMYHGCKRSKMDIKYVWSKSKHNSVRGKKKKGIHLRILTPVDY